MTPSPVDRWSQAGQALRAWRSHAAQFPLQPVSPRGRQVRIPTPAGGLNLHIVDAGVSTCAVQLYLHGGGWITGSANDQDEHLDRLAKEYGISSVAVEYRLAPEHPYPAAVDDCEAAALWLVRHAASLFGCECLMISGGSSGAHLAALTVLRLRDRHGLRPFVAANLVNGWYDLSLTPSALQHGDLPLVISTRDLRLFVAHFLQHGESPRAAEISPLFADLRGFPATLLSVGTCDPLLDDSLFLAARLRAAHVPAELAVYSGSAHGFTRQPADPQCATALARIETFLAGRIG